MPVRTATARQIARYEDAAKTIAKRHHIDLLQLRWATKYVGRNIQGLSNQLHDDLRAIAFEQSRVADELAGVNRSLNFLVDLTVTGFQLTVGYLDKMSGQLHQILEVLKYPTRTQAAEQRDRGIYLAGKGKPQQAVRALQRAVQLNETDFISLFGLGVLFAQNDQPNAAASAFDECALYADSNPALSAEAAIWAAYYYKQAGRPFFAWKVLDRTKNRNCPDLALPLMLHARSEHEEELALVELAKAFIIDAELVIAAEKMGLRHINIAAKAAYAEITGQNARLVELAQDVFQEGKKAGVFDAFNLAEPPKVTGSPRANLMNAAIYRRQLQVSVLKMTNELRQRLSRPLQRPVIPARQYAESGPAFRCAWAVVLGIIAIWPLAVGNIGLGATFVATATALLVHDFKYWSRYLPEKWAYPARLKQAQLNDSRVQRLNQMFEANRERIEALMVYTEEIMIPTLPPAVPRAFPDDLAAYTLKGVSK